MAQHYCPIESLLAIFWTVFFDDKPILVVVLNLYCIGAGVPLFEVPSVLWKSSVTVHQAIVRSVERYTALRALRSSFTMKLRGASNSSTAEFLVLKSIGHQKCYKVWVCVVAKGHLRGKVCFVKQMDHVLALLDYIQGSLISRIVQNMSTL